MADYTVEIMNTAEIDNSAYQAAKDLAEELDELADIANPLYVDAINDLSSGPQTVVDVVEKGDASLDIPAQEMMLAALQAGETCLAGSTLDDYATALATRVKKLPPEYGGQDTAPSVCVADSSIALVASSWEMVILSIGATDHHETVEVFYDTVSNLSENSSPSCLGRTELADLAFDASLLIIGVDMSGKSNTASYNKVRDAFEAWLAAIDRADVEVATP
ncbi:hypothetical protein [Zhihengliuella salsuginis]|uniref:Uncharacterized protein n=1 Tax=Zhihengliuella salsuginis TaxID=578222 RepID=A0ABQ3GAZ4_9MICC|nr:hypothetical protein [Zhihengliuella salsuginis]GHC99077.1 hypothetical protein GCM10008096_00850 [Zhihengliuella salsuginis]